ncbi:putative transposase for insertion sequence element [Oscillibacter valericigenes Sjm18-20]|nr:putative transposase for insertion sequence element [Oscillibacter valericigenes Sjm18-20]
MFKLYAYSYFNGIRSSRKIERECYRNIEAIWLINGLRPDFKTIADFRKNNKKPIKLAFRKFSMICDELDLIGKEMVAVDGSKFRASNSRFAYHSEKKIQKKIEHYNQVAEGYLQLLDEYDAQETGCCVAQKFSRLEIEKKIEGINKRLSELGELEAAVKRDGTIYETDPDSRMMQANNKGCDICHNVQIAVDDKNHLVVAVDVTSEPVDKEQLHSITLQAKEELGVESITAIADKGYYSARQFAKCKEDNIVPIVAKADRSFMAATKGYEKSRFKYDEAQDGYICPQGHLLRPYQHRKSYPQEADFKRYQNFEACSDCPVRDQCSNGEKGRTIQDRPFQRIADEVDRRTEQFADMYKVRKQTVEHPWGTIKRAMGFSYFLTRKTENVRTESLLHFGVYNMKRAINIIGTEQLIGILQG